MTPTTAVDPTTRERLVAAALEVFEEQGYEGARVQDIARAAGLTTGAIYAHYRGKAELLLEAIGRRSAAELATVFREGGDHDARGRLERLGVELARRQRGPERPLLLDALVAARRDPELAALLGELLERRRGRLDAMIRDAQRAGAVDDDLDADVVTRFALTLAMGSLVVRMLGLDPVSDDGWAVLVQRVLDALAPAGDPTTSRPDTPTDTEPRP